MNGAMAGAGARWRDMATNYLFVLPAMAMFAVFSAYPFFLLFKLSVVEWNGIPGLPEVFVGLRHFQELITQDPMWWRSFGHAAYITLLALVVQNSLALVLALAVSREIRGGATYRLIFFLPPVLSGIVVGLTWNIIFEHSGLFNAMLGWIGLGHLARSWLAEPQTALTAVAVIHMWKGFGWGFIILLAGLQGIPQELYEAAKVDGANALERFRHITVPLMIPVFFLVTILTILGTMQIFDIIAATTKTGPAGHTSVPVTEIIETMTASGRFGYASAMGIVFGLILLCVSLLQMRLSKRMYQGA